MGLFLALSGVMDASEQEVEASLRNYASEKKGEMRAESLTTEDPNCLVISAGVNGVSVLYPRDFLDWDDCSQSISHSLGKPTFSFHIHDGDLWMYILFLNGEVADRFNPIPDYWEQVSDEEREEWRGDADKVAECVHVVKAESISRYLVHWGADVLNGARQKAYPDDEHFYGDDWQLVDFMKRLGLDYPIDDRGSPHGTTHVFRCKRKRLRR